jgi:hypothetical protein
MTAADTNSTVSCPDGMPARLAARPRTGRGLPIPWTAPLRDGQPRFGLNNEPLRQQALNERRCGQCGEPLDYWIAFIGSDFDHDARRFIEPAMHVDCARYATAVCPYLASSRYSPRWADRLGDQGDGSVVVAFSEVVDRPERMCLYITRSYKVRVKQGVVEAVAAPPKAVEWF